MKPTDVKDNTDIDSNKEVNDKDPKFKAGSCKNFQIQKYFCKRIHTKLV